jgi:hypothetical protein
MPFQSQRAPLKLSTVMRDEVSLVAQSRAAVRRHCERARILLAYADAFHGVGNRPRLNANRLRWSAV